MRSYPLKRRRRWLWLSLWLFFLGVFFANFFVTWIWAVTGYDEVDGCNWDGFSVSIYSGYFEVYGPGVQHEDDPHLLRDSLGFPDPFEEEPPDEVFLLPLSRFGWPMVLRDYHPWLGPEFLTETGEYQRSAMLLYDWYVGVPIWMFVAGFFFPTAYHFLWLPYRCRKAGLCRGCGYDLTGNASGICPECGTPIPEKVKRKLCVRAGDSDWTADAA